MNISKSSWHYKISHYLLADRERMPGTMIGYVFRLIMLVAFSPMFLVVHIFLASILCIDIVYNYLYKIFAVTYLDDNDDL